MLLQELRYGIKSLKKNPGFAITAIFMLALGIGATTTIFSVVNALLLKSLPYSNADKIVTVREVNDFGGTPPLSQPNFIDLKKHSKSFEAISLANEGRVLVTVDKQSERVGVKIVSGRFFDVMKVQPYIGRTFTQEEDRYGGPKAALISEQFRRKMIGEHNDINNTKINVDGVICNIVGVIPASSEITKEIDVWMSSAVEQENTSRSAHNWRVVGRLREGVSLQEAQTEVTTIAKNLHKIYGKETDAINFKLIPFQSYLTRNIRQALWLLFGATALLISIACANYSNLLFARFTSRQTEFSIRTALGASGINMIRQAIIENLLTAIPAAIVGIFIAYAGVKLITTLDKEILPRINTITIDGRVILFSALSAILIAILTALLPALRTIRGGSFSNLVDAGRGNSEVKSKRKLRSLMVVTQIALTFVLLSGTGLLIRSFIKVTQIDPGFKTESTLVMNMSLPTTISKDEDERHRQFYSQLRERIKNLPGVTASGNAKDLPLRGGGADGTFLLNNDPARPGNAEYRIVSDGFLEALKVPLVSGRLFNKDDTPNTSDVAVISKSLAEKYWPNKNPIGETIQFGNMEGDKDLLHIVGIVGDIRDNSLENKQRPTVYANSVQRPQWWQSYDISFVIHTKNDPQLLAGSLRSIMKELRPGTPVAFMTMDEVFNSSFDQRRFNLVLFSAFAITALLIAAMGLYGVLSYTVEQRTKEIGIRTALGAEKKNIIVMFLKHGTELAAGGGVIGIIATLALSRFMKGLLFEVSETDILTLVAIFAVMLFTALIACYIPARRAANVNPLVALRE